MGKRVTFQHFALFSPKRLDNSRLSGTMISECRGKPDLEGVKTMRTWFLALTCLIVTIPCSADIIYVKEGGTGSGTSWAGAYGKLQDGLSDADPCDVIWVAEGTYYPIYDYGLGIGDRGKHFRMKNGVGIYGGFPDTGDPDMDDRDPNRYVTILSGDIGIGGNDSDNCYHVFYHPEGLPLKPNAVLDGFTITGGNANGSGEHRKGGGMYNDSSSPIVTNCTFGGNSAYYAGGGMFNHDSNPNITNCTFSDNSAIGFGGGMANIDKSSPVLIDCTFSQNSAINCGGGMDNYFKSSPILTECIFVDNSGNDEGGGIHSSFNCNLILTNCIFTGNSSRAGGGIFSETYSNPMLINCSFISNSATSSEGGGGGMVNTGHSNSMLTNCTFINNSATSGGGMANYAYSNQTVTGCTFTSNSADEGGGMYNSYHSNPRVTNCIIWDNTSSWRGNEIYNYTSTPIINYCDIAGSGGSGSWDSNLGSDGGGNIDVDPLFADPNGPDGIIGTEDDNLRLLIGSPCIDAGDNSVVDANSADLDGNPRIINGIVDMGAYEALLPIEAGVHIVPRVINRNNRLKRVMAIIRLPEGIGRGDVVRESFELYAGGLDGEPVGAILARVIGRGDMTSVFVLFDKGEVMDAVEGVVGRVELTVVGRLESGQYIYGSDTVRIVQPRRRRPHWQAGRRRR